jgi:hypothetical protein
MTTVAAEGTPSQIPKISNDGRHMIYVGNDYTVHKASTEAFTTLLRRNTPPTIFVRGNQLVQIIPSPDTGIPFIRIMSEDILAGELNKIIKFYKATKSDEGAGVAIEKPAPKEVVKFILNNIDFEQVPILDGITSCPIMTMDGELQTEPGYNAELRIIYQPTEADLKINIKMQPELKDVADAIEVIKYPLSDFKFVEDADRANMIGLLISTVFKTTLKNTIYPMAIITKPIQGAGASKLCRYPNIIKTGAEPNMYSIVGDEEIEKKLLGCAVAGEDMIIYDNINSALYSSTLAKQITLNRFSGRILGKTGNVNYPLCPVWIANGVNVITSGDMPRRCYPINLDPGLEKPWERNDFKEKNIDRYVFDNRGRLLSAIFTLIRYWIQNKKNASDNVPIMGSFEEWRNIIGGILSYTEYGDKFLTNVKSVYETCEASGDRWVEFLTEWYLLWNTQPITLGIIIKNMEDESSELKYCLPGEIQNAKSGGKNLPMSLGKALSKIKNRVHGIKVPTVKDIDGKMQYKEILVKIEMSTLDGRNKYHLTEVKAKAEPTNLPTNQPKN